MQDQADILNDLMAPGGGDDSDAEDTVYSSSNEISDDEMKSPVVKRHILSNTNSLKNLERISHIPSQVEEIKTPKLKRVEPVVKSNSKKELEQLEKEKNDLLNDLLLDVEGGSDGKVSTVYSDSSDDEQEKMKIKNQNFFSKKEKEQEEEEESDKEVEDKEKDVDILVRERNELMAGLFDMNGDEDDSKESSCYSSDSGSENRFRFGEAEDEDDRTNFFMSDDES